MALRPVSVDGAQIANSATTYYTATNKRSRIDTCALTNTTAGAITATVYIVPSGGTAGVTNCVLSAKSIAAGATYIPPGVIGQWLETGGTLQALASSATSITIVAIGVDFT